MTHPLFKIHFILSSPASSFVSSLVSTSTSAATLVSVSAATLVLVSAVIAVLAIVVVGVEIRIETLFLLVLEEAGTLVFLIAEFGSGCGYCIADISIGVVASALRSIISSALLSMTVS